MDNEVIKALISRRSIRKYKTQQITDEELKQVLEAGIYAPTGKGTQSPLIIAVQNQEDIALINRLSSGIMGRDGLAYYGAPTIILVFYTELAMTDYIGILDASAACTNMLNAAHALGLGSCWIHRCKEVFETEEGKALLKKWGVNEKVVGVASMALGYPDMEPFTKPRREGQVKIIK
ncbi:MAG: nitroreductase [Bacilli bacterium]|nr:nitroreductase [Bacilli bacterium]